MTWAEIFEALAARSELPRTLSVPRRIFLSYRWGDDAQNAWVDQLATALEATGNVVVFDQHVARESPDASVTECVARMADCSLFLMVIDPPYVQRVGSSSAESMLTRSLGWAWDEYSLASHLARETRLRRLGILRAGDELPRGMSLAAGGQAGTILDARTPDSVATIVHDHFQQVAAPPDPAVAREAAVLLHESERRARCDELENAHALALRAVGLIPELPDGHRRSAVAGLHLGRADEAHLAAERALSIDPMDVLSWYLVAEAACALGNPELGMRRLGRILLGVRKEWRAHLILAHGFAELDQLGSARAHRDLAFALEPRLPWMLDALRVAPGALGDESSAARAGVREALSERPPMGIVEPIMEPAGPALLTTYLDQGPEQPERTGAVDVDLALLASAARSDALARLDETVDEWHLTCDYCHVGIRVERDFLCASCGAQHGGNLRPCFCGGEDFAFSQEVAYGARIGCPFCHTGLLRTGE